MTPGRGAVTLGGLTGELELLLNCQHWLGIGEQLPSWAPGEGGVVEVEGGVHLAALMQPLQLIKQGIELIVEERCLRLMATMAASRRSIASSPSAAEATSPACESTDLGTEATTVPQESEGSLAAQQVSLNDQNGQWASA